MAQPPESNTRIVPRFFFAIAQKKFLRLVEERLT